MKKRVKFPTLCLSKWVSFGTAVNVCHKASEYTVVDEKDMIIQFETKSGLHECHINTVGFGNSKKEAYENYWAKNAHRIYKTKNK
jgi:hypothetical protein